MEAEKEQVIKDSIRGFFSNSFFHIYINGEFNSDISLIKTQKDKGTVIHEYTHYIQNIGTLWGLYCSIARYEEIIELKEKIKQSEKLIRPLAFPSNDRILRKRAFIHFGNGTVDYCKWKIDTQKIIKISHKIIRVNDKEEEGVFLTFQTEEGIEKDIQLGAFIIKESMAAMLQGLVDPEIKHDDMPYNIIPILVSQKYPQLSSDVKKLICCCHASLFNMNPGLQLLQLLDEANSNPELNGFKLFDGFVSSKIITTAMGKKMKMKDFFNFMLEGFKQKLSENLSSPLDYIDKALERVKLDSKFYPFLSVLYDEGFFNDKLASEIIGYYGIPYIQTINGLFYPTTIKNSQSEVASIDILEMIVQEAIIMNMCNPERLNICPLYYMCSGSEYEKPECYDTPWKGKQCSYKIISDKLNMDTKEIL